MDKKLLKKEKQFVDNENIASVTHHGEDCEGDHVDHNDDYNTPFTSVEKTTFKAPGSNDKQTISTL